MYHSCNTRWSRTAGAILLWLTSSQCCRADVQHLINPKRAITQLKIVAVMQHGVKLDSELGSWRGAQLLPDPDRLQTTGWLDSLYLRSIHTGGFAHKHYQLHGISMFCKLLPVTPKPETVVIDE